MEHTHEDSEWHQNFLIQLKKIRLYLLSFPILCFEIFSLKLQILKLLPEATFPLRCSPLWVFCFPPHISLGQYSQNSKTIYLPHRHLQCPVTKSSSSEWRGLSPGALLPPKSKTHLRKPLAKIKDRDLQRSGTKLTFSTLPISKMVC